MHRRIKHTESWIASAILVLTSSLAPPACAEDGLLQGGLRKAFQSLGRSPTVPTETPGAADREAASDGDSAANSAEPEWTIVDSRKLTLVVGQTKTVTLGEWAKRFLFGNKEVADARINQKKFEQVFVTGLKPGISEITVLDQNGEGHRIEVLVTMDASPLQQTLAKLYPDSSIEVIPAGESGVAVIGYVDNPQAVSPIMEIAKQFHPNVINGLKVVGTQQVQLRVLIAEVSRTKLRAMGFNFLRADSNSYFTSTVGGLLTVNSVLSPPPTFAFSPDANFTFGTIGNEHLFRGFLRALKQEGLVKIVAEPTLTTFSGRSASMIVGGEFPIIVPGQQGTFSVEFREYGNRLEFVPIVLGGGRIRLEVRPELSQLDYSHGVVMQGFTIPGIQQRRIDTSVELNTGETFVVGGLLSTTDSSTTNKVPYLGDIALIGAAFRTVSYSQEEKELVIMVTPELVEPMKPDQRPCYIPGSESTHPSNGELYWKGNVESPVCTPCEISRRIELGLDFSHGGQRKPSSAMTTGSVTESKRGIAAKEAEAAIAVPDKAEAPSEVLRPGSIPGLLGPLGYDAGR